MEEISDQHPPPTCVIALEIDHDVLDNYSTYVGFFIIYVY